MDGCSLKRKNSPIYGGWYVVTAAILWGTTGTAQAFAPSGAQPMTVGAMRLFFGAIVLFFLALVRGDLAGIRQWRSWPPGTTILAAAGVAAYQIFFFAAVAKTGVAVGTIVGIGTTPIAAGVLVYLWHRERPGRRWIVATALAILGCAMLILTEGTVEIDVLGIFLAIAAGTSYALYTLLSKELLAIKPAGAVLTVTFTLGVFLLAPIFFLGDFTWLQEPRGLLVALHLGIVTVGFAYLLFAIGLSTISVATAATLTLAEPLTAALLGVFVLGETLNWVALVGVFFILDGLLILTINSPTIPVVRPGLVAHSRTQKGKESTPP